MQCVNCSSEVTSAFCPHCGQRSGVARITLKDSLRDFWAQVAGFDGLFFRTLRDLTLRPGVVARSHINGVRVKYFGPIGYFFFMITLLLLWLSLLQLDFIELIESRQDAMQVGDPNSVVMTRVTRWVSDNIKWVLFLAVPFQALVARFVFFRRSGMNFAEHTVPLFYTAGHLFWLTMATFAYHKVMNDLPAIAVSILSILYFGYVYSTLITHQSRWKAFSKGIGVYVGGQLLFALALVIVGVVFVVGLAMISPETFEGIRPSNQ